MPEFVKFLPQKDVLTFEEIVRFAGIVATLGVDRIRLTGGEPLVRAEIDVLIRMLKAVSGIEEVALTTNAVLLDQQAERLKSAGLDRLNISLDTIDADLFKTITRRDVLDKVMSGIDAAQRVGFEKTRINAVPIPLLQDQDIIDLAKFAKEKALELRFIEYMPLDGDRAWEESSVRSGDDLKRLIESSVGALEPVGRDDPSQPAFNFQYRDDHIRIGFINSVTSAFCKDCNRMRLTAEGKLRNCLFSNAEWDLKAAIRSGTNSEVEQLVRTAIAAKKTGHGSDDLKFIRPDRAMYQIGG